MLKSSIFELSNGIPVVYEQRPNVRSVAIRVHVNVGTRHERDDEHGMAHFLEHMLFKGTPDRNAFDIANAIERFGGSVNAYTSKEETVFYANVIDEQLPTVIDVFADMLMHSDMRDDHIAHEQSVVLEEIKGSYDTPDDIIWDYFIEELLAPNTAGKPTLGSKESVRSFNRDAVVDFWKRYYHAGNMVIGVVGNVDRFALSAILENSFGKLPKLPAADVQFTAVDNHFRTDYQRSIEQSHILYGRRVCDATDDDRFPIILLNNILGAGMSSRMFQNIREKYGFAYSVYSSVDFYSDHGLFINYVATDKSHVEQCIDLVRDQLTDVCNGNVSERELEDARLQVKGALLLSMESNARRVDRLIRSYLRHGRLIPVDELIEQFMSVDAERLTATASEYMQPDAFSTAVIGAN